MNRRTFIVSILTLGTGLLAGGCASKKIAWDSRIGSYSWDDAVLEMGPPDKEATLEDGTRVCEWRTAKGNAVGMGSGSGFGLGPYAPYSMSYTVVESPDYYLRLTFSPENRLLNWKRVRR